MSTPQETSRALVLGGGGLAGIAWEVGVLLGLADSGVDLTDAERIVGTSAGSVVGALVASGADLEEIHAVHRDAGRASAEAGPTVAFDLENMGREYMTAIAGARDVTDMRARIGAWALRADTVPEAERRRIIAARLPGDSWSDRDLRVVAVDTSSGETAVFTREAGVGLVDAVGASCAVPGIWPPVTIGDRRYMDGGVRSIVNLDVADTPAPADRTVVVAPLDPPEGGPFASVGAEVDRRREAHPDAVVTAVLADEDSRAAFGPDVLDPATMPPSAAAGRAQGRAVAADVARAWGRA